MTHRRRSVHLAIGDAVATVTLDRAPVGNAIDRRLLDEVAVAVAEVAADRRVRVLVLRGAGPLFCVGADLRVVAADADRARTVRDLADAMHDVLRAIDGLPIPIVSLVHGTAAGAGVGLALAADFCLMATDAQLVLGFPQIGLSPDSGLSWRLPRLVGPRRAMELMLLGDPVGALQAERLGLVTRAVAPERLEAEGATLVGRLATGSPELAAAVKRLAAQAAETDLDAHLDREAASVAALAGGAASRARVDAFVARKV